MTVGEASAEADIRARAIAYVQDLAERNGGVVSRAELESFRYGDERIPLIDPSRGIRNPRQLAATLSILSSPDGPYSDEDIGSGLLRYAYRAGSPDSGDNRKLRRAAQLDMPLILLRKIADGIFVPVAPVYLIEDDPEARSVTVALDEGLRLITDPRHLTEEQRRYAVRIARMRLHQPVFRARVVRAYGQTCAMCRLRHPELLDAAHILPDTHPRGIPVVPNGLALCKIHHAAYDQNILGVRPDLYVEVQPKVLAEIDGPMLRHGLQEMAGVRIIVPRGRGEHPDGDRLAERYEEFLRAG
jgi:putative restriction endonuclease